MRSARGMESPIVGLTGRPGRSVTTDTHFLVASTTKSMSSLLVATFVDEGLFGWDQMVVHVWAMLNEHAAIVTYQVDAHAMVLGREILMKDSVTSGWAKRGGEWLKVCADASAR